MLLIDDSTIDLSVVEAHSHDLECELIAAHAELRSASSPSAPAPAWARRAAEEIRTLCHEEVYSESDTVTAIILKHHANPSKD